MKCEEAGVEEYGGPPASAVVAERACSCVKLGRDVFRPDDGPSDAHRPTAAGAHGDLDAKHPGQQRHPRQPRRSSITHLSLEQGCGRRELHMSARDKERELLGRGRRFISARHDRRTQCAKQRRRDARRLRRQRVGGLGNPRSFRKRPEPQPFQCRLLRLTCGRRRATRDR